MALTAFLSPLLIEPRVIDKESLGRGGGTSIQ